MSKYYKVVEEGSWFKLSDEVEKLMEQGWEPQGGVSAFRVYNSTYYAQAMIKE